MPAKQPPVTGIKERLVGDKPPDVTGEQLEAMAKAAEEGRGDEVRDAGADEAVQKSLDEGAKRARKRQAAGRSMTVLPIRL